MIKKTILALLLLLPACLWAQELRYATFNIRYADGDRHTQHDWKLRRDSVARFIQTQDLSICCMQEVLHRQLRDLRKRLPQYDYVGVGRDNGKRRGEYSPIFYLRQEWKALQSGTFWLSPTPDKAGSKGWDAALPRIATWALLQNRQNGRKVMAINTHFDHVGHQARLESGRLILQKSTELAAGVPLILTGDFNVGQESDVYHTITHSSILPMVDTHFLGVPHEGVAHTFHNFARLPLNQCSKIDFLFSSPGVRVLRTFIPGESREPGAFQLSDHNPIIVTLELP